MQNVVGSSPTGGTRVVGRVWLIANIGLKADNTPISVLQPIILILSWWNWYTRMS
jgi:hypothetical protein